MKKALLLLTCLGLALTAPAQQPATMKEIPLQQPDLTRGKSILEALALRQSTRAFAERDLSVQDLSELLWAANGINRPESGKRTAPSAMNRQDIKVYACLKEGSYLYDAKNHKLTPVSADDVRPERVPLCLVLVSDENGSYSGIDAGIVSQNISLFCAGVGLATYPRGTMERERLTKALKLEGTQTLQLCHPVGYPQ